MATNTFGLDHSCRIKGTAGCAMLRSPTPMLKRQMVSPAPDSSLDEEIFDVVGAVRLMWWAL